jgi:hypothetical protein
MRATTSEPNTASAAVQPNCLKNLQRCLAHAKVAHDVLDLDDGVVHQDADHQRHGQQSDHVDGEAQIVHADEGGDDGQRQRRG